MWKIISSVFLLKCKSFSSQKFIALSGEIMRLSNLQGFRILVIPETHYMCTYLPEAVQYLGIDEHHGLAGVALWRPVFLSIMKAENGTEIAYRLLCMLSGSYASIVLVWQLRGASGMLVVDHEGRSSAAMTTTLIRSNTFCDSRACKTLGSFSSAVRNAVAVL